MGNGRTTSDARLPVKIVLQRRAHVGHEASLERWVRDLLEMASESGELEGSSVLTTGGGEYFVLLRFSNQEELEQWVSSSDVLDLLQAGDEFSVATDAPVQRSGLETWFAFPGLPVPRVPPPKWKMALLTWLALLPQVFALSFVIPDDWPRLAGVAAGTALPVSILTWFAMPNLSKRFHRWLYAPSRATNRR